MSRAPLPPSAARSLGSFASKSSTTLTTALLLFLPACYEGPDDTPEGEAWEGDEDDVDDDDGASPDDDDDDDDGESSSDSASGPDPSDSDTAGDSDDTAGDSDVTAGGSDSDSDDTAGDSDDTAGDSDDTGPPPSDEVPDNEYCGPVAAWDGQWLSLEDQILAIVNEVRAEGADCGSEGTFGPAGPMTMAPALRCAARVHSKDMADRGFFDHTNPSGESPWDRMGRAGYAYMTAGENIAAGNPTAAATMEQWMNSDGHCSNIMSPGFTEIGVGYYPGGQYGHLWTQVFATPQ